MLQYLLLLESEREREFFRKIYRRYRTEMFCTAYRITGNRLDSEDIVHETFLALISHMDKLMDSEPHKVWNYIMTSVKHKSYNLCRKRKLQVKLKNREQEQGNVFEKGADKVLEEAEQENAVMEALKQMKSPYQEVLLLRYYHQMSVPEIAELLEKTPDNIRHISSRAKKKLQEMLEEIGVL